MKSLREKLAEDLPGFGKWLVTPVPRSQRIALFRLYERGGRWIGSGVIGFGTLLTGLSLLCLDFEGIVIGVLWMSMGLLAWTVGYALGLYLDDVE